MKKIFILATILGPFSTLLAGPNPGPEVWLEEWRTSPRNTWGGISSPYEYLESLFAHIDRSDPQQIALALQRSDDLNVIFQNFPGISLSTNPNALHLQLSESVDKAKLQEAGGKKGLKHDHIRPYINRLKAAALIIRAMEWDARGIFLASKQQKFSFYLSHHFNLEKIFSEPLIFGQHFHIGPLSNEAIVEQFMKNPQDPKFTLNVKIEVAGGVKAPFLQAPDQIPDTIEKMRTLSLVYSNRLRNLLLTKHPTFQEKVRRAFACREEICCSLWF